MNIEELKLILDTIGQIADGATTAALVWMALHYLTPLIATALVVGGIAACVIYVVRLLIGMNEWAELGKAVSRAGGADTSSSVYSRNQEVIDLAVRLLKDKN
mgnify:CR=1 FL=1